MKLGDIIYDALPYLYTLGGVLTLLFSGEPVGQASGVLLISSALLIFHLRLEYRARRVRNAEESLGATQMILARVSSRLE